MGRGVRQAVVACVTLALVATGCAADAQRAGNDAAAAGGNAIRFYLETYVVPPHAAPAAQFARVNGWLANPPLDELEQVGRPAFRVLASHPPRSVDLAVWAYGETTAIEGKDGAVGHVCLRYTIGQRNRVVTKTITCPSGLPEQPD